MTMPKKSSRPIIVDKVAYRFKVNQNKQENTTKIIIEETGTNNIIKKESDFLLDVTPSMIESIIRENIK